MPMKQLLHRLQPIQVYIVLVLSILYFSVQMFISQKSQSLTLLVHAYHMLCNIIALSGCIITIKNNDKKTNRLSTASNESSADFNAEDPQQKEIVEQPMNENKKQQHQHEKSLKNTFGWARVDVLTMVIVCTFLTSLCFSVVVEVIQTLFHITHKDHVEHEEDFHHFAYEHCIILGALGLVLNGISYLLIGGYTYHQGSFLQLTADGNVYILERVVTDGRKISDSKETKDSRKSQKIHELSRDVCSAIIVIFASVIIVFCNNNEAIEVRLIDPLLSLVSIAILLGLSYPYMKEAAQILLQTIPDSIDIEDFQKQIIQNFPEIQSIHDLHIWQLTQEKFVSTAHIIFLDPSVYKTIINDVLGFFHEQGINIVTIQPEFKNLAPEELESVNEEAKSLVNGAVKDLCLVACREVTCEEKLCCTRKSSDGSENSKTDIRLEQVISIRNISAEELNTLSNCTSAKSLNYPESEESSQPEGINKKRSSASLHLPSKAKQHHKLQKAISAIDQELQQIPATSTNNSDVSIKKFVSESVIESSTKKDHALGRQQSEILVENRMLKQLNKTNNEELEDLYEKCDKET